MDKISAERRSDNMRRIRSKDTRVELRVRRLIHGMGYRYRLHNRTLPGKPDLVFPRRSKAIFIHGCFWHQHDDPACLDGRRPKSNSGYWELKLDRNKSRDVTNQSKLRALGWDCLVVWECQTRSLFDLGARIRSFLD